MEAKEMLEHYKLHGERVDEVLYQTVMNELNALQITQNCFEGGQPIDEPFYQKECLCKKCCKE